MSIALAIFGWTVFALVILAGLALNLLGLFGNWLILAAVAAAGVAMEFEHWGWRTLLALLVLAVAGEVLEAVMASVGAGRAGGSRGAMVAALVGTIAGAIVGSPWFPIVGTILGAIAGAFLAAMAYELVRHRKTKEDATRVGIGAAAGKVGGIIAKTMVGVVMLAVIAFAY